MTTPKDEARDLPDGTLSDAELDGVSGGVISAADQARMDQMTEQMRQAIDLANQQMKQIGDSLKGIVQKVG